ncbi:glutathione S-transferase family protein [Methylobacterium nodulans]|uniref:Glutathione S-transferase domain protein n=1 Tax=Methylobacterium nodulans (strain LMG 21967 / CNCM I-2342 / ORS 2060) TaxID=460265 RepID=B8IKB7_METNO|nr:glutathione S-transferase [Methylobacterium nodulans]ACL61902.1 Glutathione S-transferase domain protein [Methylobacterium nodulans ORS 2060]
MKLYHSVTSPFVRKVMVTAHELGLVGRLELLPAAAHPVNRDGGIVAHNPLGQVPTLILDDGTVLADSRVICEYLDHVGQGGLFPRNSDRWGVLAAQSLGDGLLDAALLVVYEGRVRAETERSEAWVAGQRAKMESALQRIEAVAPSLGDRLDIGTITFACALGYLDLRFPEIDWHGRYPAADAWFARFNARPSMRATMPA